MSIKLETGFDKNIDSNKIDVKKDNELEYIKDIIKDEIKLCKEKTECLDKIIKNLYIYESVGIDESVEDLLVNLKFKFETIIPSILVGDYDKLLLYENTDIEKEDALNIYKAIRKKIINNLKNNK